MEAASIASVMTEDPEILAAAVLHDVIEDCGVTREELRREFGERVAALVQSVTEPKDPDARGSWQRRKLHTVGKMREASTAQMILMLSDKLSNLRSIERDMAVHGSDIWLFFHQSSPAMQYWYYASMGELLYPLKDYAPYQEYVECLNRVFPGHGRGL
jgi:myo-inositol-1(or 4)-monophosphatase